MAAISLGHLGYHEAIEPLVQALNDRDSKVSDSAALALAEMGGQATLKRLQELLPAVDASLSETIQHTIQEIQSRL